MKIERLCPVTKDYIWGGDKLIKKYGKTGEAPLAESWELSFHKDGPTRLSDGRLLSDAVGIAELGSNAAEFEFFPALIKFIDAKDNLSVQVHPSDDYALENEHSYGKTETWYIVEAEEGAGIYLGLKREVTEEEFSKAIETNTLTDLLNFYEVKAGERYFIPSGTIHAIGKGCLILEIQQNSNLTYRVYDYGRVGKDGKTRELHVEKAMRVANLKKFTPKNVDSELIGASKYFTSRRVRILGETAMSTDAGSFCSVSCVCGKGTLDGQAVSAGDSFFIPSDYGKYTLNGDMEIVMTQVRKYYLGIDLGGTFIKGGIVDDLGKIIASDKIPTEREKGDSAVAENIAKLAKMLLESLDMSASDVVGIGMGVPGMIDSERGEVVYSNNLGWKHFMIADEVKRLTGLPVKIANDANVAALGETKFGSGKLYKSTVMITLGTGVGGGIIIDGKLFEGNHSAGAELGHSVICAGGEACSCGRRGCLEAYASASALIRDTKRAMEKNPESKMWEGYTLETVSGKTAFDYKDTDESAKAVVDRYIEMLGVGLVNIANVFRPEAILLGGGVCAEGDNLIKPLEAFMKKEIYAGDKGPEVKILIAELGNSAGLLGAAALLM